MGIAPEPRRTERIVTLAPHPGSQRTGLPPEALF
jgi:hypothetical protein